MSLIFFVMTCTHLTVTVHVLFTASHAHELSSHFPNPGVQREGILLQCWPWSLQNSNDNDPGSVETTVDPCQHVDYCVQHSRPSDRCLARMTCVVARLHIILYTMHNVVRTRSMRQHGSHNNRIEQDSLDISF
jgi:hypothetical protein